MNKKLLYTLITFLVFTFGYFTLFENKQALEKASTSTSRTLFTDTVKNKKLSKILKNSKKTMKASKVSQLDQTLESRCVKLKQELSQNTISEFAHLASEGEILMPKLCKQFMKENEKIWADSFFKHCNNKSEHFHKQACESVAFFLKASVMYDQIKERAINSYSDEELVQAFFGTLSGQKNIESFSKVLNELDKRFPNSPSVAKARIVEVMKGKNKTQDELLENIEPLLGKAIDLNPEDVDLTSIDMYIGLENNEQNYEESLSEYNKNYPDSGLGIYYQAAKAWKAKKVELAKELLKKALSKEPNNQQYKTSLAAILKPEKGKNPFFFQLGFNSEDF